MKKYEISLKEPFTAMFIVYTTNYKRMLFIFNKELEKYTIYELNDFLITETSTSETKEQIIIL